MLKTTITLNRNESFRFVDLSDEFATYIRVRLYKNGLVYEFTREGHRGCKEEIESNFPEPVARYMNEILRRHGLPMVVCSALEAFEYNGNL